MYDLRSYDKGPFSSFLIDSTVSSTEKENVADWTGLKFSPDGRSILVYTNGTAIRLIDAFKGEEGVRGNCFDVNPTYACKSNLCRWNVSLTTQFSIVKRRGRAIAISY